MADKYSIVIVNWNSGEQLRNCLDSINNIDDVETYIDKVVVVDNASSDGSYNIKMDLKYALKAIKNTNNMGFAHACNQGAYVCSSKYIIFLNPDTRLFKTTINELDVFIAGKKADIKVVGIKLVNDKKEVSKTCSRFPSKRKALYKAIGMNKIFPTMGMEMKEFNHTSSRSVDQVMGAFFVVENEFFRDMKGFDERFFVYYEEVDFCKRTVDSGYRVFFYADAKAYHKGGGTSSQVLDKRLFYINRSYLEYEKKHNGSVAWIIAFMIQLLEYFTRAIILFISGQKSGIHDLNKAYAMLFGYVFGHKGCR